MVKLLFFFVLLQLRCLCSQGNMSVTVYLHTDKFLVTVFVYWRICLQRPTVHRRIFPWNFLLSQTNFSIPISLFTGQFVFVVFSVHGGIFLNSDFVQGLFCQ
jgi:hypothetical protein